MNLLLKISLTLIALCVFNIGNAQFSLKFTEPDRALKQAIEHYEYGHYQKAKDLIGQYLDKSILKTERTPLGAQDDLLLATAHFYKLLVEVGLKEDGAMANFGLFLAETPFASLQQYGYFKMAKSLFAQQSFVQAIPYYEKASINYLSNAEITQRNFELAYCYLLNNQLDKVNPLFASIKDVEGQYFSPGNYYHGVLSYYKGDYDASLKSFEAVQAQEQYKDIVPFYIAELKYFKGEKKEALQKALHYLKQADAPHRAAMRQLAGQIYYERGDFKNANTFLTNTASDTKNFRNDDYFRAGYVKYQMGELEEAIVNLEQVKNNGTDLYAQSLYYLGLSHLKNGDKKNALRIFKQALSTDKLGKFEEDVQFNTAKLNYELEGDNSSEKRLDQFIEQFPNSQYYGDAVEMLALLNIKSKNFEKASTSLRKLGNLSPIFQAVYQKVNYARGIQLLKSGNADQAILFFTESEKYPVNDNLIGLAEFWKTECHYRLGQYKEALSASYRFIDKPGNGNSPALLRNAFLTNAYIHMHENEKEKLALAYVNYLDTTERISAATALSEMDSIKPNYVPSHIPFVEANPYVFIYQFPTQEMEVAYKPVPLTPMAYNNKGKEGRSNKNYVKLGVGNFRTSHAELGYDLSDNLNKEMYLTYVHRASKSSNFLQQASQNQLRLISHNQTSRFDLNSALTMERNVYRPYGSPSYGSPYTKNRFFDVNLLSKINPMTDIIKGVDMNATVGVGMYNINSEGGYWNGTELSFLADVPIRKKLNETTTANLGIQVQANGLVGGTTKPANISTGSSFVVLKPSIEKNVDDLNIQIGLYPVLAKKFHLLPNVSVSKFSPLLGAKVGLGVESELIANSYKQLSQVNPFINLVDLQQTKRILYYGQIAGAIYDNFNYSIKAGGGRVTNLPLYINDTIENRNFDVWYEKNATILSLQANVEYQLNYKTNAGIQLRYEPILNTESYRTSYHYVPLQFNAFAKYSLMQRFALRADLFVRSATNPLPETQRIPNMGGAFDLNLRADYQLGTNWNVFVELNNLLNNKYSRWYQYPNYGMNVLGGFVYSFDKSIRAKNNITKSNPIN